MTDRLLGVTRAQYEMEGDFADTRAVSREMVVTGSLDLGKSGNPVTIIVEDEITGESLEIGGVRNAFLIIEDSRRGLAKGWMAMAVGSVERLESVLDFLSKTTVEMLRKFTGR